MVKNERRVVITGLGLVTPVGNSPEAFWSALAEGVPGVRPIEAFPVSDLPCVAGAEVLNFDPKSLANPKHKKALTKSLKYMARDIQLAVAAAELALADAGLLDGGVDPTRFGIDLGAGLISSDLDELAPSINAAFDSEDQFDIEAYGRTGIPLLTPIWLLKYLPNMLACHISILNDCQGPSNSITESEAAAILAMGEAARIVGRNRADVMVTGGADSKIHPLSLVRGLMHGQLSQWTGEPARACRPFDRQRSGWVPGEGAGILLFEELEHARGRGARIYGEVLGFGSASDAYPAGGLDPDGGGTERAIRAALRDAGLQPAQVGHINAHGAATQIADLAEARAFHRVFGPGPAVPVTALKGQIGNLASGCGGVELIASLLAVRQGMIPPTLNCDEPDPACDLDMVRDRPRPTDNPVFVTTNLTRFGQAAAMVVRGLPDPV